MDELKDLLKEPETFKEKIKDIWFTISYCYPRDIRDFWWGIKRFFRNIWRYRHILRSDNDWDFGYLEMIIMTKLEFMAKYFRTSRIVVSSEKIYEEICLAIRLGKIFMDDYDYCEDYSGYVNIKNIKRFYPKFDEYQRLEEDEKFRKMIITELRKEKAKYCFYNLLKYKEEKWWD